MIRTVGGTLIVTIPCQSGLVICADKRKRDGQSYADDDLKIGQLGDRAAFAVHGRSILVNRNNEELFNLYKIVTDFFRDKDLTDIAQYKEPIAMRVMQQFSDVLQRIPRQSWPPNSGLPDNKLFHLLIVYLDRQYNFGKASNIEFEFRYNRDSQQYLLVNVGGNNGLNSPNAYGSPTLLNKLLDNSDERFFVARNDPALKPLVFRETDFHSLSEKDAINCGKKAIEYSNKLAHLMPDTSNSISAICDCAILDYQSGFRWISTQ